MRVGRQPAALSEATIGVGDGSWQQRRETQPRVLLRRSEEVMGAEPVLDADQERSTRLEDAADLRQHGLLAGDGIVLSESGPFEDADEEREITSAGAQGKSRSVRVDGGDVRQAFGAGARGCRSGPPGRLVQSVDVGGGAGQRYGDRAEAGADVDGDAGGAVDQAGHVGAALPDGIADLDAGRLRIGRDHLLGARGSFESVEDRYQGVDLAVEPVNEAEAVTNDGRSDHAGGRDGERGSAPEAHGLLAAFVRRAGATETAQGFELSRGA